MDLNAVDFAKGNGLVPVIVQKCNGRRHGKVLMLAYADREALELTVKTGLAHFWSWRTKKIWKKGETSGNTLQVENILVDCDGDTLLFRVRTNGPVCHTGNQNCFFQKL